MTVDTLPADPQAALRDLFGFAAFRPGQEQVVRAVLDGDDVLAVMPTGAGKSLCYQLPAMLLPACTVVISPLVALMKDQVDSLPPALRERAALFNSAIERDELDAGMADLAAGRLKLVYVAPERLRQRRFIHALQRAAISRFVIDEAHCISLWGHDFRPDYFFSPAVLEALGDPPVLAMTATATPAVRDDLRARFRRPLRVVHTGVLRPNLSLAVERAAQADDKLARLLEICTEERGSGIVYTATRDRAEEVARVLRTHGVSARHYHAGMTREERADTQDAFMLGRLRVIAATVAFGMGVDKPDVRFIAHVNPSRSLEAYAQESGRAGRDGEPARCILFWSPRDATTLARWARDDALTPALLQAVHRAVWAGVRGPFAWHTAERLARTVGDALGGHEPLDETTLRVALGALEQVGVLRRHCDLPEQFRLRLLDGGHPLAAALDAAEGERLIIDPFDLAGMLGVTAAEVEERLLAFQDDGALTVQGLGRGMLLERLPHPPDLAQRLKALLDGRARSQADRLHQMEAYATARTCRAALIAHHFGVEHAGRCGNCDICRDGAGPARPVRRQGVDRAKPRAGVPPPTERAPEDLILECVAELPFAMGRTGVCRVLKGSIKSPVQADRSRQFGALAAMAEAAIEREIERMVDAGWLVRDDSEYRRLSVTPAGFAKPPAPWPPPQAAPDASAAPAGVGDDDPATIDRFERLRAWRATTAREAGLPAYTVFHDATLRLIAARVVRSVRDLQGISGIGPAKLERYGAALVELLADA